MLLISTYQEDMSFIPITGLVVSNELTNTNVLIQDVFSLLFQVKRIGVGPLGFVICVESACTVLTFLLQIPSCFVASSLDDSDLIFENLTLIFDFLQVNKMIHLEEMHIKNLKIRSLQMGQLLLDNLPNLKKASNWSVRKILFLLIFS